MNSNKIYIDNEYYYEIKRIKNRIISVPCDKLKFKQRYILRAIKWVYPYSINVKDVVKMHSGKKWVLKMDIKDFYNSVPLYEIEKCLKKVSEKIYSESDYTNLLDLVTLNRRLPVGAPTSPIIANACFYDIDKRIRNLCSIYDVDYSRYVDDLTFSAYNKEVLNIIEKRVTEILSANCYQINKKKTKYISDNKQQNILGLVVNNYRVRLSKDFRRKIRAMLHNYAIFHCETKQKDIKYQAWNTHREYQLQGYLSYIKNVDKSFYNRLQIYCKTLEQKYFVKMPQI